MVPNRHIHSFVVEAAAEGTRIDRYLTECIPDSSRAQIQRAAQAGTLHVDGRPVKVSYRVRTGDQVTIQLSRPVDLNTLPTAENIELDITYQDESIIVVNKPAGMVVHPAAGHRTGTLVNALLGHGLLREAAGPFDRPGIVHRLDKGTSGLLVCALTEAAHRNLARQLHDRTMSRTYMAVAWGHLKSESTVFEGAIGRSPADRKRMAVTGAGRPAKTTVRVIERFDLADYLQVNLESGRTHQIRVHLSHAGHPIVGDDLYGGGIPHLRGVDPCKRDLGRAMINSIQRPALHARALCLTHPVTGHTLEFSAAPPPDFDGLLRVCRTVV